MHAHTWACAHVHAHSITALFLSQLRIAYDQLEEIQHQSLSTPKIKSEKWLDFCLRNMGPIPDTNTLADVLKRCFWLIGRRRSPSLLPHPRLPVAGTLLSCRGEAGGDRDIPAPAPTPFCCCIFMSYMTYIQTGSH